MDIETPSLFVPLEKPSPHWFKWNSALHKEEESNSGRSWARTFDCLVKCVSEKLFVCLKYWMSVFLSIGVLTDAIA
jgi:hypothetical protein